MFVKLHVVLYTVKFDIKAVKQYNQSEIYFCTQNKFHSKIYFLKNENINRSNSIKIRKFKQYLSICRFKMFCSSNVIMMLIIDSEKFLKADIAPILEVRNFLRKANVVFS